jgi:hypothetical protein
MSGGILDLEGRVRSALLLVAVRQSVGRTSCVIRHEFEGAPVSLPMGTRGAFHVCI